jgi:hypothetical protein
MRLVRVLAGVVLAAAGVTACVKPPPPPPPVTLADLNGSFTGTTFYNNEPGCPLAHEFFEGEYEVPNLVVREVEIDLEGCINATITTYAGTFTIDTDAGTLTGFVGGTLRLVGTGYWHDLRLRVDSATGRFESTVGGFMELTIQCNCGFQPALTVIPFTATLTAA